MKLSIEKAVDCLRQGEIIAYPTEAIYGLGCAVQNEKVLQKLIDIKKRSSSKGFILISSNIEFILPYIEISSLSSCRWKQIQNTWPGPYTWVFPASPRVLPFVRGKFNSVAVRVTSHPVASLLSSTYQDALVSTSANTTGEPPFKSAIQVKNFFGDKIAGVVEGEIGNELKPTSIQDAITGKVYR